MHEVNFSINKCITITVTHPNNHENSYLLKVTNMVMELSPLVHKPVHCSTKLGSKFKIDLNNIPEAIDHWIISLAKQVKHCLQYQDKLDLIAEAAYLDDQFFNETVKPRIEKKFTVNKLKSKKRRKSLPHRFKMDDRNSIILATPDQRTDLQKLKAIMRKLHCIFTPKEMKFYSNEVQRDLYIPETTSNNVFRGSNFIKALIKHYKQTYKLTYGDENAIKQTLHDIGYNDKSIDEILNETKVELETQELDILSALNDPTQGCTHYLYDNDDYFVPAAESTRKNKIKEVNKDICTGSQPGQSGSPPSKDITGYNQDRHLPSTTHKHLTVQLNNTNIHELRKLHLALISFCNNTKSYIPMLKYLCNFLIKHKKFVEYYLPFKLKYLERLSTKLRKFYHINKRQRKLITLFFFNKEKLPSTGQIIIKLKHPWKIVFENHHIEWPLIFQDNIIHECQEMDNKSKTTPYVEIEIENSQVLFTIDSGCSANILNADTYTKFKHLELSRSDSYTMSLRNIQSQVSSINGHTSLIPLKIGTRTYKITFHVFENNQFQKNYLGTQFMKQTRAILDYNTHHLVINKTKTPLYFLNRDEALSKHNTLTFQEATINSFSNNQYEQIIDSNFSLTPKCFDIFGSEQKATDRIKDILETHHAGQNEEILEELDLNKIEENNRYPLETIDKYVTKKLYLPQKQINPPTSDQWKTNNNHLTNEQLETLTSFIDKYDKAISTPDNPIGKFNLFQININLMPGKDVTQHKRNTNWNLAEKDVNNMLDLGIVSENLSNNVSDIANLLVVSKTSRLTRADKHEKKKLSNNTLQTDPCSLKFKQDNKREDDKSQTHRVVIDFSDINQKSLGRKYISLQHNHEIINNLSDCYLSSIDLTQFFHQLPLDQNSRNKFNFYWKDKILSYNVLAQGHRESPFFSTVATKLTFSQEGLKLFLQEHPGLQNEPVFQVSDPSSFCIFYIDDGLFYSKKSLGWKAHFHLVHYALWSFQMVNLKVNLNKCSFLVQKVKFLGTHINTNANVHSIPENKLSVFKTWQVPTSLGSLNSRLSSLAYFNKYLPLLKLIAAPLLVLAKQDVFKWEQIHEESWAELMYSLNFSVQLSLVKESDKLAIFIDASVLSTGFALVKVNDDLSTEPIIMESRIYATAEKKVSIVNKEILGLLFALEKCEMYIRSSKHTTLVFTDCMSISLLKQGGYTSQKMKELGLLISTLNIKTIFLKGKYNYLGDTLSRQLHSGLIKDTNPPAAISDIVIDIRKLFDQEVLTLSPEQLSNFLLQDDNSEAFDMLRGQRVFSMKDEYLQFQKHPCTNPTEMELLFCLTQIAKYDLRFLSLSTIQDYLISLNKARIPKGLLQDFIKFSKSKVSSEMLAKLFPMTKCNINSFLERSKLNNDIEQASQVCVDRINQIQSQYNVKINNDNNWIYKNKARNTEIPTEAANIESSASTAQLQDFLFDNSCSNCNEEIINGQHKECLFKTENNGNIVQAIQHLVLYLNEVQSTTHTKWLEQHIPFICYKNINSLVMIIFYIYSNQIIDIFETQNKAECVPVFYHLNPDSQCALEISATDSHTTINIIAKENINVETMSSQTQPINLHLYLHTTQACLEGQQVLENTITTIPHANQYTHTIHVQDLIIDNFSSTDSVIKKDTILAKLLIFNTKRYDLIKVPQHIFSSMERNMLKRTSVNSLQYLSSILAQQLLSSPATEFVAEEALFQDNNSGDRTLLNYMKQFPDLNQDLSHLIYLITSGRFSNKKTAFIQAQKLTYLKQYQLALENRSRTFLIREGILYHRSNNGVQKIALPWKIVQSTFVKCHLLNKHVLLNHTVAKIRSNFYIPEAMIKKALNTALRSCITCALGTPTIPRRFIGEERSVSQYMASNKTLVFDVAKLKVNQATFLFLIGVDLASQFCVGTLVKDLTVTHTQQFIKTLTNILGPPTTIATDSGSEFSEELSILLNQLQITHKRFDPQSKNQSLAEPMINVYRTIFSRLVNNYQRSVPNNTNLKYDTIDLICSISLRLLNDSKPNFSAFSRKELFFGLFYNNTPPPWPIIWEMKKIYHCIPPMTQTSKTISLLKDRYNLFLTPGQDC